MKVINFDTHKGLYHFEFNELISEFHAHPVVEIINAFKGTFSFESREEKIQDLEFLIIDSNVKHKILAKGCHLEVLMIESYNNRLVDLLECYGAGLKNGFFAKKTFSKKTKVFLELTKLALNEDLKITSDERINDCIKYIEENDIDYKNLISAIKSKVFLSESRISHLFKEHIGVSVKKFSVWIKLKRAIKFYLDNDTNLTNASFDSGFFDQAHLANSFKSVFGVKPSKAYNSRTFQV